MEGIQETRTGWIARLASAWAAVGVTSWADFASFLAALYTLILLTEWLWKRVGRAFCERRGWLKPQTKKTKAKGFILQRVAIVTLGLSAAGLVGIVVHEGFTDRAIVPVPGDVPTVGFGSTEGVKMGDTITPPRALERALRDAQRFEGALKRCVKVPLHQHEYDAYVSLSYNIGAGAFCGSTLVRKLNAGDYAGACAEISRWNRQGGRVLRGLVLRRERERALCEGGPKDERSDESVEPASRLGGGRVPHHQRRGNRRAVPRQAVVPGVHGSGGHGERRGDRLAVP